MDENIQRPALLVLVRHAESERNRAKKGTTYFADEEARRLVVGIPDQDIDITPDGEADAENSGCFIRERFGIFDYAYHSGYKRTKRTLDGILSAYTEEERALTRVREKLFLRERHAGYTYDMTEEEAEKHFPWLKCYWETHGGFISCPPGGESLANVVERVYLFLNMLFRDRAGQKVLVVTHGGTLRCFRYLLENWTYEQAMKWPPGQSPINCGVTFYDHDRKERRLMLGGYNLSYQDE